MRDFCSQEDRMDILSPFFPCQSNPWVLWATLTGVGGEHLSLGLIRE